MPKRYSTSALLTLATGVIVGSEVHDGPRGRADLVGEVHQLFGDLLGWDPFSHQLAQEKLWNDAQAVLRPQHPWAFEHPIPEWGEDVYESVRQYVRSVEAVHGTEHYVEPVTTPSSRPQGPFEGFPADRPIVPVVAP